MTLSRRSLIGLSIAGAAAMTVHSAAAQESTEEIRDSARTFFKGQGFREVPDHGIITGHDFNHGLLHDVIHPQAFPKATMGFRLIARTGDIDEINRPGVLASFHVLGLQTGPSPDPGTMFDLVMDFLVNQRNLDPARMLFVSTEMFRPILGRRDDIAAEQFLERTVAEAEAAGDGSGVFAPSGHPYDPKIPTAGIYYRLSETPSTELSYPPEGYIEIAEVAIGPFNGAPDGPEGAGIGLERVAMAEGRPIPDFEDTRLNLLRIIEDEARREGKPLPPGYAMFASL